MAKTNKGVYDIDENALNVLYIQAKIQTSPKDYSMRDRAIAVQGSVDYGDLTVTYRQDNEYEAKLAHLLGADNPALDEVNDANAPRNACWYDFGFPDDNGDELQALRRTNVGLCYKHNDFLINATSMDKIARIGGKDAVLATMKMYNVLMAKDSIIPQLTLSRLSATNGLSLDDVANITFVRESLENGKSWLFPERYDPEMDCLSILQVPAITFKTIELAGGSRDVPDPAMAEVMAEITRQNVITACLYLCEVIRAFNKLSDKDRMALGAFLFEIPCLASYKNIQSAFGSYDPSTCKFECPEIDAIADKPNEERYGEVVRLVDETLRKKMPEVYSWTGSDFAKHCNASAFPVSFAEMYNDLNLKAWEDFRVKNFALMLSMCKEKGVDLDSLSIPMTASTGESFGGLDMGSDAEEAQHFGDMHKGTKYEGDDDDEREEEKTPPKKRRAAKSPTLSSMSDLLKTCDTKYKISVDHAKNDAGYKQAYLKMLRLIDMITKQLTKQIREIKTYNTGGKNAGKTRGKLDPHTMHRYKTDPRIFYDNTYKVKEMDLAFGIVLDQSGSMWGEGVKNGSIALIMLHHVLNALRVNHAIIGHNSKGWNNVQITKYVCFNEDPKHTLETPYMLANLHASGGNCDSGALNYMEQYIGRVQNKDRIVLIFNDGEPSECEESDLREQVRRMEQEGIHVIGLGIDFENIKLYYPDHANGRNMKEMTSILVSILKRYVLEKKD